MTRQRYRAGSGFTTSDLVGVPQLAERISGILITLARKSWKNVIYPPPASPI